VATVGIDASTNAGLLAVQILAINDEELSGKFTEYRTRMAEKIEENSRKMKEVL